MDWKSVKKDGLPDKDYAEDFADYLVIVDEFDQRTGKHYYDVDTATFGQRGGYIDDCWATTVDWGEGNEVHVIYWCRIELPNEIIKCGNP